MAAKICYVVLLAATSASGFVARPLLRTQAPRLRAPVFGSAAAALDGAADGALPAVFNAAEPVLASASGNARRSIRPRRKFGRVLRDYFLRVLLMRYVLTPASARASAGLASVGLSPPPWARALITIAILVTAQRLANTEAALEVRARCGAGLERAKIKFARKWRLHWRSYITIPFVAAGTGWLTNRIAVWMIFYPLEFVGLPLWVRDGTPLGLLGWRGIVPAKTGSMAHRMVDTLTKLVHLPSVFARLQPDKCASLLMPGVAAMVPQIVASRVPDAAAWARPGAVGVAKGVYSELPADVQGLLQRRTHAFIAGVVREMSRRIESLVDLRGLVVGEMLRDRSLLGALFQRVGRCELAFLVNSGLFFGFALGIFQMVAWVLYDAPWTLAAGGAVVGYLTNWIALKLIFEPVEPVRFGPWALQGLFLTRQKEVSGEFAASLVPVTLTSAKLWENILTGKHAARFDALLREHTAKYVDSCAHILFGGRPTELASASAWAATRREISDQVVRQFPAQLHRVSAQQSAPPAPHPPPHPKHTPLT